MKNKKNLLLVILLLVVVAVASASTFAWLTDTDTAGSIDYTVGEVSYEISKLNAAESAIVPGQVLGSVSIINKSNVLTNLRISLSVTVSGVAEGVNKNWSVGADAENDEILLKSAIDTSIWVFDSTTNYYYYGQVGSATTTGAEDIAVAEEEGTQLTALLDTMTLNGGLIGNEYAGATITVVVTFEAKQADYVEWSEMGNIDFTTGIKKAN